jgi:hypothetical protein
LWFIPSSSIIDIPSSVVIAFGRLSFSGCAALSYVPCEGGTRCEPLDDFTFSSSGLKMILSPSPHQIDCHVPV